MHINFLRALIIPNKILLLVLLFPILMFLMSQESYAQVCGNGVLDAAEVCDDGNTFSDDGCSGDCLSIEAGFNCITPGELCISICGDGIQTSLEVCDDGNDSPGDGCSATCQMEIAHNVPALGLWGLLALAGVLGIIGLMVIRRRKLEA
jgi:cysteine-rich repeat protein